MRKASMGIAGQYVDLGAGSDWWVESVVGTAQTTESMRCRRAWC
jgi:hypothetical protein